MNISRKQSITESDIYRACIILSIIGLGTIHISHSYLQPEEVDIGEIDETWLGNSVTVNGTVTSYNEAEEVVFLQIADSTGSIQVVDFEMRNVPEKPEISGYVDIYQGNTQIVMEEVNSVS